MATAAKVIGYPHIVKIPDYCGGKATIDSTRVRVNNVAWLAKQGRSNEEILAEYPDLTLPQVLAALLYYHEHKDEIEAELAEEDAAATDFDRRRAELIAERSRR